MHSTREVVSRMLGGASRFDDVSYTRSVIEISIGTVYACLYLASWSFVERSEVLGCSASNHAARIESDRRRKVEVQTFKICSGDNNICAYKA